MASQSYKQPHLTARKLAPQSYNGKEPYFSYHHMSLELDPMLQMREAVNLAETLTFSNEDPCKRTQHAMAGLLAGRTVS